MNRITQRDLDGMLGRLRRNMVTAKIIGTQSLCLEYGSKVNGNSYNVITLDDTAHRGMPFGTFHFGFTARDCYDRMHAMCVALELVSAA